MQLGLETDLTVALGEGAERAEERLAAVAEGRALDMVQVPDLRGLESEGNTPEADCLRHQNIYIRYASRRG